mgnify:CR=1 FL=1
MQKKTKYIIAASVLVLTGVGLSIVLGKGKTIEDVGELPNPDASGNIPPSDGTVSQTAESQEVGGSNAIQVGDLVRPYGSYVNVRTSMEINNGWFWNNLWITGDIDDGKVHSPNIVGEVLGINQVGGYTWYEIDMGPATDGLNTSQSEVQIYYAQDDNWQLGTLIGYVRGTTCDEVDSDDKCIGIEIPTLKKV